MKRGIQAYSDADWTSDDSDRCSTPGHCVSLRNGSTLVSWKTKKQPTVTLCTCEAEYISLASSIQYLQKLLGNIDNCEYTQLIIHEDNQGVTAFAKIPVNRQRAKHVDIRYHFIGPTVSQGRVTLVCCPTDEMIADLMTKPTNSLLCVSVISFNVNYTTCEQVGVWNMKNHILCSTGYINVQSLWVM